MGHIFLSFLFYNVLLYIFYRHYRKGEYYIKTTNLVFYTILMILFGAYGGGEGDYFVYKLNVEQIQSIFDVYYSDAMEMQYYYLAYLLDGDYFLWRIVIFSIQFIGLSWFLYMAKLNTYPTFFCFTSICLYTAIYGRSFWGAIFFFMGVYLMIERKNPLFLIAVALSYFSHTSNLVLIALLPLAFFDVKKWQILLVIICSGFIISYFNESFTDYLNYGGIEGADYLNNRLDVYSERSDSLQFLGNSIGEVVAALLRYIPMFAILFILLKHAFYARNKYYSIYKPCRRLINITLGVVMISFIFLFASVGSNVFAYRVLAMVIFPLSLILPYLVENKIVTKKKFSIFLLFFILSIELNYIKDLYYCYVGGNT